MRGEWYWAISYTEVGVVASGRQVMYWAPDKKTAVALKCLSTHSAVGRSFTFWSAQAEAVHRSSGHAISQPLIVRQVCCKCSCPGGPVCRKRRSQSFLWPFALKCLSTYSILHRPWSVRFSSVCLFCFNKNKILEVILGLILGFLWKSCCSKTIVTDFLSNMHLSHLGFQPSYQGAQKLPRLLLQL